jgi:ribonuclease Z
MIDLTILGCSAAMPAYNRHPTSQLVIFPYNRFLIDCGEGTQMQMMKYQVRANRIRHIFISHLHGDHYLGLVGLFSSMHLQKRQEDLNLYAPKNLAEIIRIHLKYGNTKLNYKINFFDLPENSFEIFYEDEQLTVHTLPMTHRIQCNGFLFQEKPKKRKVLADKLPEEVPFKTMTTLKDKKDVLDEEGNVLFKWEDYTIPSRSHSFAHCSDTKYNEDVVAQIDGVDMLYHESTFLHEDLAKAEETFHSTALQAAQIAAKAQVGKLIIGHFSSRYSDAYLTKFLEEAKSVFENTFLAVEGENFSV